MVDLKRSICHKLLDFTRLNLPEAVPLFAPNSSGHYHARAALTLRSLQQTFPALSAFAASIGLCQSKVEDPISAAHSEDARKGAMQLKEIFDINGSDKANTHNYHYVYGEILKDRASIRHLLEIGIGSGRADVVSNMGDDAKPGASLRAFRDFLPNANIYGADIDRTVLFSEERIQTFFVDQCDLALFSELSAGLPQQLDVIIDDGLHSPHANIITMTFALPRIKIGGYFIVEDIVPQALPFWEVVFAMLPPDRYETHIYNAKGMFLCTVKRLA